MSHSNLDVHEVGTQQNTTSLNEQDRLELTRFLNDVADSALKVKILRLFLSDPGLCLASPALADRVGGSIFETRRAVQQLDGAGALNYCPHFAFTDLCHLSLPRLPQFVQRSLALLITALRLQPELVWCHFESEEDEEQPVSRGPSRPMRLPQRVSGTMRPDRP